MTHEENKAEILETIDEFTKAISVLTAMKDSYLHPATIALQTDEITDDMMGILRLHLGDISEVASLTTRFF